VKVNTVPIEAYRQAGGQVSPHNRAASKEQFPLGTTPRPDRITLPQNPDAVAGSVKASVSPSLLSEVLTYDEKATLVKYFARFGDSPASAPVYGADSEAKASVMLGARVDVKG
jgi:hypothetical protein